MKKIIGALIGLMGVFITWITCLAMISNDNIPGLLFIGTFGMFITAITVSEFFEE